MSLPCPVDRRMCTAEVHSSGRPLVNRNWHTCVTGEERAGLGHAARYAVGIQQSAIWEQKTRSRRPAVASAACVCVAVARRVGGRRSAALWRSRAPCSSLLALLRMAERPCTVAEALCTLVAARSKHPCREPQNAVAERCVVRCDAAEETHQQCTSSASACVQAGPEVAPMYQPVSWRSMLL